MKNFGFYIQPDSQIDFDNNNRNLAALVSQREPSFDWCIGCGTCTATCTAGNFTGFNFRKVALLVHRGENEQALQEVEKCMLCGKCNLACPRGVNTRNVVASIQKIFSRYQNLVY
ncbi:MAG: 4Fe-4S dicluster domain-containing protein [Bacteroidota bacterium]|nr:4Fe-4S dicluster domain-containing protein [Bacteroidota bacterium]MDP4227910.1 4Fe-4S dicluster domain-containing protein [Bacteroidota bacterium]MDP4273501.1 4Fe-4S dicluster domain-containing protein [Bacteroidota bacterium]